MSELRAWATERAIQFEDLDGADPRRLAALDGLLAGKRLVLLGEADHFVGEVLSFRTLLLRYLIGRGFRWVGEELGVCDGLRIDRYLESGDEAWLHRLPSFGDREGMRIDRDDSLAGLFGGQDYPNEAMRSAHAELARRLRLEVTGPDRVHWFGLDADNAPGGAYEDLAGFLAAGGPTAASLAGELTRVPGESVTEEVARLGAVLTRARAARQTLAAEIGVEAADQVLRSLLALREGLIFVRDSREATDWAQLAAPMARRESSMVSQARSVIAGLPVDGRMVLLGHAAHLSKDWPAARLPGGASGPPPASLGTQLARDHPGQVLSVWLLHGSGSDTQPLASLPRELALVRGTLNHALAQVGDCFLLPLGPPDALPELLRGAQDVRWIYGAGCRTPITAQADAVLFTRRATPLEPSGPR